MISKLLIILISLYQGAISPFTRSCCRYSPTCSEYVRKHIQKHGALKSFIPCIKRVLSCHPFSNKPFWDPVN